MSSQHTASVLTASKCWSGLSLAVVTDSDLNLQRHTKTVTKLAWNKLPATCNLALNGGWSTCLELWNMDQQIWSLMKTIMVIVCFMLGDVSRINSVRKIKLTRLVDLLVSDPSGPVRSWSLCDGDPLSGSWWFCGASWGLASWRPACFCQQHAVGPAHPGPGRGGPEVHPTWNSPAGDPEASGGRWKKVLNLGVCRVSVWDLPLWALKQTLVLVCW